MLFGLALSCFCSCQPEYGWPRLRRTGSPLMDRSVVRSQDPPGDTSKFSWGRNWNPNCSPIAVQWVYVCWAEHWNIKGHFSYNLACKPPYMNYWVNVLQSTLSGWETRKAWTNLYQHFLCTSSIIKHLCFNSTVYATANNKCYFCNSIINIVNILCRTQWWPPQVEMYSNTTLQGI